MILTFLLPLVVWPRRSSSAPYSLESWSATDPVDEVAPMGVRAFLGILYGVLRSSMSLVTLVVVAMAAVLVSIVVSFVAAVLVSIVVSFSVKYVFVAMASPVSIVFSFIVATLASIVGSFVVTLIVVATAAPVSVFVSFVAAVPFEVAKMMEFRPT